MGGERGDHNGLSQGRPGSPPPRSSASVPPDTIRKMKNDFRKMEDEMDRLATNMAVITDFSARISSTLQDRHERITKLAGGRPIACPAVLSRPRWGSGTSTPDAFLCRGARAAEEAAVPLRAAFAPHQVRGAGRLRAGGALPGPGAGRAAAVPAPALLPRHPGRLPGHHGPPGPAAPPALQVRPDAALARPARPAPT